jgi:alpha-beta hydrolase superfamily lysophospholipase
MRRYAVRESLESIPRLVPVLFGILIAAVCAAPASAKVPKGPAGNAFYTYSKKLPSKHGAAIWQRKLTGQAALKGGSSTLLLYSSTGLDGKPVPVSAVLTVPKGKAPKGGWPIVSWAHGTTGIADQCAPSRSNVQQGYDHPLMQRWIKAGYAVVRTDYQGLGTAGPHPYLIGDAEGHDVLDAVLAARLANRDIGNRVAISGHSQGGQAALFAASLASKYAPSLKVKGTVAFAPVSHLAEQGAVLRSLNTTGLTALAAMIVRGIDIADPALNVPSLLTPQAATLYPQIDTKCLSDLGKPDSFGSLPTSELFRSDANLDPVVAALGKNDDPEDLKIKAPVQIEQGLDDTTVFPAFTDQTAKSLKATYKTYAGLTHATVVTSAKPQADATAFLKKKLG